MSLDKYATDFQERPIRTIVKVIAIVSAIVICLSIGGYILGWFSDAAVVAKKEFSASTLLKKYEWFKDASAQLDKKRADIHVMEKRLSSIIETYGEKDRTQWTREDREQYNVWASEVAGITASYNQLASEYNSQMSKFNWRFTNVGDLPEGATMPLPREYKPYEEK